MAAKAISVQQGVELLSKLGANTDWGALDSSQVQKLIDNPRELGRQFTLFVRGGGEVMVAPRNFTTWKIIKLGVERGDSKNLVNMLRNAAVQIGGQAEAILGKLIFNVSDTEQYVDLVRVTVAELGFKRLAEYGMVCAIAQEHGLEQCPAEVAPQLCLQCSELLLDESVNVAMKPVSVHYGNYLFTAVKHRENEVRLDVTEYYSSSLCHPGSVFVFVRRK